MNIFGSLTIFVEGRKSALCHTERSEGTRCESTICERTTRLFALLTMTISVLPQKFSDNLFFGEVGRQEQFKNNEVQAQNMNKN